MTRMNDEADLRDLLELNRLRALGPSGELESLEASFNTRFGANSRLAVYGTLAPGRANHHHMDHVEGEWISGLTVHGELVQEGWGADMGYPALRWSLEGPSVSVELFVSAQLVDHWPRLDDFEGSEYRRILVPLYGGDAVVGVANLYAVAD